MIRITYDDGSVLNALNQLQARMSDLTPVMRAIAGVLEDASARAFENERAPSTGAAWQSLLPATVKARGGDAHPILQRSGQLAASITSAYGKDFAEVGTNKLYAATHQFGRDTIPARPFIGIGDQDRGEIMDIIAQFLASPSACGRPGWSGRHARPR